MEGLNNYMKLYIKPFITFLIPIITYHFIMYIVGDSGDDMGIAHAMQEHSFWELYFNSLKECLAIFSGQ